MLVGLAVFTVIWVVLWAVADRSRPLGVASFIALAVAMAVLASCSFEHGQTVPGALLSGACGADALAAQRAWRRRREN